MKGRRLDLPGRESRRRNSRAGYGEGGGGISTVGKRGEGEALSKNLT